MPDTSDNPTHAATLISSDGARQTALAAVVAEWDSNYGPVPQIMASTLQRQTDIQYFRRLLTSALAAGASPIPYMNALRELGTGGQ